MEKVIKKFTEMHKASNTQVHSVLRIPVPEEFGLGDYKAYAIFEDNIDSHNNIPQEVYENANEIQLWCTLPNWVEKCATFYVDNINLPPTLDCFRVCPSFMSCQFGVPHSEPKSCQFGTPHNEPDEVNTIVLFFGDELITVAKSRQEAYEAFAAKCLPRMKIPYGCKVYIEGTEIVRK